MIIIYYLLVIFELIVVARVLLSWFPNIDRSNPLVQLVFDITEPVLRPIRDLLPQGMMLDLSPLIVILILNVLMQVLF
ncbi:MAG TPA: YggT family protein [Oceanobacillus sp.]|nr:YggT family protein [Oceanobacillus sp.]